MRIKSRDLPEQILDKVLNPDPLEGEDVIIEDDSGKMIGVIIHPDAYEFFLRKVEERENELDAALDEKYDPNAPSLNNLMGE